MTRQQHMASIAAQQCSPAVDEIKRYYNCRHAYLDLDGDVWIEDPQSGHWLDADCLDELDEHLTSIGF